MRVALEAVRNSLGVGARPEGGCRFVFDINQEKTT